MRLSAVTGELQQAVMSTRMQPIGNAWRKLPRVVYDRPADDAAPVFSSASACLKRDSERRGPSGRRLR